MNRKERGDGPRQIGERPLLRGAKRKPVSESRERRKKFRAFRSREVANAVPERARGEIRRRRPAAAAAAAKGPAARGETATDHAAAANTGQAPEPGHRPQRVHTRHAPHEPSEDTHRF